MTNSPPDLNRNGTGRFMPGQSGNPQGRPKGIADKRLELKQLLYSRAEELIQKTVELALAGDANVLRLCLERLVPRAKDESMELDLPIENFSDAKTLPTLGTRIIEAVAGGKITPEHGKALAGIVEVQRKNIETCELEIRLTEVERSLKQRKPRG